MNFNPNNFVCNIFKGINSTWLSTADFTLSCYSLITDIMYNLTSLKKNSLIELNQCTDIVVYDEPGYYNRFTIIYIILSTRYNTRINLYTQTTEIRYLPSIVTIFRGAGWSEREIWDLYGIFFMGHPDLRRLLLDYGFKGHPLRKDFPLTGYVELRFNENINMLVYTKTTLLQEYKIFNFTTQEIKTIQNF
jgi:NADH:ubiquinone oxidoreductase subunit C